MTEFICSLSGVEAEEEELIDDAEDSLGAMPVGWTKVTFQRRLTNPRLEDIQQGKDALVQVAMSQIPEESREAALRLCRRRRAPCVSPDCRDTGGRRSRTAGLRSRRFQ